MFIQGVIRRSPSQTGILPARPSSDKFHEAGTITTVPDLLFGVVIVNNSGERQQQEEYQYLPLFLELTSSSECCGCSVVVIVVVVAVSSTVRALYAGTLATIWTTAPSLPQRPSARLAVCLLLATLTTAARCYASSNATHPLVQFEGPTPSSFSPIDDSSARVPHSSTLVVVLSRPLPLPPSTRRPVQSDTSVIVINSKKLLLHNQNSKSTTTTTTTTRRFIKRFRTKRELKPSSSSLFYNRIAEDQEPKTTKRVVLPTTRTSLTIDKLNLEKRSDVVVPVTGTSETDSVGDSDRVKNTTVVNTVPLEAEHQNDSSFFEEDAPSAHSEGTERPMPPVHDHGNASYAVGCERRRRGGGGRHGPSARRKSGQRTGGDSRPPSETARRTHRHRHQPAAQHSHAGRRGTSIHQLQIAHQRPGTGVRNPPEMHKTAA